jgi:hypothetical protein
MRAIFVREFLRRFVRRFYWQPTVHFERPPGARFSTLQRNPKLHAMPDEPVKRRRSAHPKEAKHRRRRKRTLLIVATLVVLAALAVGSVAGYRVLRQHRMISRARSFIKDKEFMQASLSLQRALQVDPKDLVATQMMAEVAEAANVKEVVYWRRSLAELQPTAENHLAWANAALKVRDANSAAQAMSKIDEEAQKTADYHDAAARLALLQRRNIEVGEHVAEAAKLDPQNELYQLELAAVRLGSPVPEVRKQAFATIEQLVASPKVRRAALRTLIQGALAGGDARKAMAFAAQLTSAPEALFEDRLLYLQLLRQLRRVEFWWYLAQLQAAPLDDQANLAALLSSLNNSGYARVALDWGKSLPEEVRTRMPVCLAMAESYALLNDWNGLTPILKLGPWGELEFQREALTARMLREQGDDDGSKSHWNQAVTMAGERPQAVTTLLRMTAAWKWDDEYVNLLWTIAKGAVDPRPSLELLLRQYTAQDRTKEMLNVFTRLLELDPKDATIKNNAAYALMLLGDRNHAVVMALEAYQAEPTNPGFVATYAYGLHLKGKTAEGLKILRALDEKQLETPSTALSYGILLAANGAPEAKKYLDLAEAGHLLPQEKALAVKAREIAVKARATLPPR